ncbi:Tether containing UBX domain for GLUT4 [Pseudocercospora fuligena]|uniref:Tether containing UBX domain for GLUT4 n=1 Tax=Pseudocercospora fuligena TaxID=685502 RepID=A0A8H6VF23_9PEZI|nr:Tether containing UBX domain for GLUT4 [Pseudocercospora fuligena]
MSTVFVVDSSLKRTTVKVTPAKYLREILEEACKARKLDPNSYTLKTQNNKTLDLSQQWRLSGLTPGAKLQLTQASRSPSVVSVALQLPESDGSPRIHDKFPSNTSLWQVLRKFEDGVAGGQEQRKLNLTQRGIASQTSGSSGRLLYHQPVLQIMSRTLDNFTELQKSLGQLGINSGSVLLKLSYKSSGRPLEEAMSEIGQYFSSLDSVPAGGAAAQQQAGGSVSEMLDGAAEGAHAEPVNTQTSIPDAGAENAAIPAEGAAGPEPSEDTTMPDAPVAQRVENDVIASSSETAPGTTNNAAALTDEPPSKAAKTDENATPESATSNVVNGISVYRPPSSSTPAAALQEDDPSTYEPTVDHARAHQASLNRAGRNQRLLSDKELEEQESARQEKLAAVKNVRIRVKYPDGSSIELTVDSNETASNLYATVQDTLAQAPEPFELKFTGNKGFQTLPKNTDQKLVKNFGFRGSVLVTLLWGAEASAKARQGPSLRQEYASVAKDYKVQLQSQQAAGEQSHREAMKQPEKKSDGGAKVSVEDKMKKFLGFGKKK